MSEEQFEQYKEDYLQKGNYYEPEKKGYYEIVKSDFRGYNFIHYGMKKEDETIVIPVGYYTENEIRMAVWELCRSIESKYEVVAHMASIPNWTVVK